MDFDLSPDQQALATAARELLDHHSDSAAVRRVVDNQQPLSSTLWSSMVEQGWPTGSLPEDRGGAGLGWVEMAVLAEAIGSHAAPAPFISTAIAAHALYLSENSVELDELVAGKIGCSAWGQEPVPDLPAANLLVIVDQDEVRLVHQPGLYAIVDCTLDPTREFGRVSGSPPSIHLGGSKLARDLFNRAAVLYAASLVGACGWALRTTTAYAAVRHQFGQPIAAFQAIRHMCAEMHVDLDGMRAATFYAAWAVENDADDASIATSVAKAWCSDAGRRVLATALQVHGGIGFTWEHDLHLYLKRVEVDARQFGDDIWHRRRIASFLEDAASQPKAG